MAEDSVLAGHEIAYSAQTRGIFLRYPSGCVHLPYWRHVLVQIRHDPQRAGHHEGHDKHAKREREYVVRAVRSRCDVQKKHQMNSHQGDGESSESQGHAGRPEQRRIGGPERYRREHAKNSPIAYTSTLDEASRRKSAGLDAPPGA
jgi:hypothetical protein